MISEAPSEARCRGDQARSLGRQTNNSNSELEISAAIWRLALTPLLWLTVERKPNAVARGHNRLAGIVAGVPKMHENLNLGNAATETATEIRVGCL